MKLTDEGLRLSATDLSQFLACKTITSLDRDVAEGRRPRPTWVDPMAQVLRERGLEHERAFVHQVRAEGRLVTELADVPAERQVAATLAAMRAGADVIVQGALEEGRWFGRPDVLLRVPHATRLGGWGYEALDTKLSRETRAGTLLQLCLYSELIAVAQGVPPESFHVVTPGAPLARETYRVSSFAAYYRQVRRRLEGFVAEPTPVSLYPEPVEQCAVCKWFDQCDARRRADDHLSLVAGLKASQARELVAQGISTLAALAVEPLPLRFAPRRGAIETLTKAREQARVQLQGRTRGPTFELLPDAHVGLSKLPVPSDLDLFFDLEADPFVGLSGREYLFGLESGAGRYEATWGLTDVEERAAFERLVDTFVARRAADPSMHVYHFGAYEEGALKRLMGRHGTRGEVLDGLLRAGVFVDLHAVVRQSVRASVETYGLKQLEPFHGFRRAVPLRHASAALRATERFLERGTAGTPPAEVRDVVLGYNRDDCDSTLALRDWLERLRLELEQRGVAVPRPAAAAPAPPPAVDERARRAAAAAEGLRRGLPADTSRFSDEDHARRLLADLLEWHRREERAMWWELFRLAELTEFELADEPQALSGLELVEALAPSSARQRAPVLRFRWPPQDTALQVDDEVYLPGTTTRFGSVARIDRRERQVDIKAKVEHAAARPSAVYAHRGVDSSVLAASLARFAEHVVANGFGSGGAYSSAEQLLLRRPPRLASGRFVREPGEDVVAFARRIGGALERGVFPIQGPPGSGKTHTGAQVICELVRRGKRVGVSAVSHEVIAHLLEAVVAAAGAAPIRCVQKGPGEAGEGVIRRTNDNARVARMLADGEAQVAGGTPWLWAREELRSSVDVLVVDEAGQMSLANALAIAPAGASLILLGDPQQLEQPLEGSHPEGSDVSALEHLLGGQQTISNEAGLLLPVTWRLPPSICGFTSELFYEGRLIPRAGLEHRALRAGAPLDGAGLWLIPVAHRGNQSAAPEEVEVIARLVEQVLTSGATWVPTQGEHRPLRPQDVLIVAPYNLQVRLLKERLEPLGVRVGTVDKFQGQQAPLVLYSMTSSSREDAPRGMEFLYSLNRLNVATSRAECACVVVASAELLAPECATPRQMRLANALCRYAELARVG